MVKRTLKSIALYLAIAIAAQFVPRLVLYFRVLDASAIDVPVAMKTRRHDDRHSMAPSVVGHLRSARIDSEAVIGCLFHELQSTTLHGTKPAGLFARYPIFLMILEYDEGAHNTFMYMEVDANRKITLHKDTKNAYYGYISETAYDLLTESYHEVKGDSI